MNDFLMGRGQVNRNLNAGDTDKKPLLKADWASQPLGLSAAELSTIKQWRKPESKFQHS